MWKTIIAVSACDCSTRRAAVFAVLQFPFRKEAHPALLLHKLLYKVSCRILKQLFRRPVLLDFSVIHHQYLRTELQCFLDIMCDKQNCDSGLLINLFQFILKLFPCASALAIPTLCCCPPESSDG